MNNVFVHKSHLLRIQTPHTLEVQLVMAVQVCLHRAPLLQELSGSTAECLGNISKFWPLEDWSEEESEPSRNGVILAQNTQAPRSLWSLLTCSLTELLCICLKGWANFLTFHPFL